MNELYYGDNLDVLRQYVDSGSVDLVYLDPPFNSQQDYNVLFREKSGSRSQAQIRAFTDTWTWDASAESTYMSIVSGDVPDKTARAVEGMLQLLGRSDMLAYLVMMTPRLVELHRVLSCEGRSKPVALAGRNL